ncbi:MAG: tenascin-X [Myxococcaceae bacterium]|nr:MAG: tenascin-X [Myxococcaceae bacterium]
MKARLVVLFAGLSLGLLTACGNMDVGSAPLAQEEAALGSDCPCGGVGPWNCNPCAFICGDAFCDTTHGESLQTCPEDCALPPSCGDGWCNNGETSATCPSDCGPATWCGDGLCNGSETATTCPSDCGSVTCGDGLCDFHEMGWCADCGPICTGPNCPQVPQNP